MNQKKIISLLLLILVLNIIFDFLFKTEFGTDYYFQTAGTLNLLDGNGYSLLENTPNCSNLAYSRLTSFPIGYSIIISPYIWLTSDIVGVHSLMKLISILFLTYLGYQISLNFKFSKTNQLLLISSIIAFLFSFGHVVDFLTICVLILSIYIYSKNNQEWKNVTYASLLLVFTVSLRYAYYPQLMIFPALFIYEIVLLKRQFSKSALVKSLFIILPFALYFFVYILSKGEVNRLESIKSAQEHWNFDHIIHFRPVFLDMFIDTYQIWRKLGVEHADYDRGYNIPLVFRILLLIISITIFFVSHLYLFKFQRDKSGFTGTFLRLILLSSVFNLLFIYFLSVYYSSVNEEYIWTWAMLPRYFLINFFVVIFSMVLFVQNRHQFISRLMISVLVFFLILNIVNSTRLNTMIYSTNRNANLETMYPNVHFDDFESLWAKYIKKRGEYCLFYTESDFALTEKKWINITSELLSFNLVPNSPENSDIKNYTTEFIGSKKIYLVPKHKQSETNNN